MQNANLTLENERLLQLSFTTGAPNNIRDWRVMDKEVLITN